MRGIRCVVATGAACTMACAALVGVDAVTYSNAPTGDAGSVDGRDARDEPATGASDGGCDDGVLVPAITSGNVHDPFCIDAREVSIRDYNAFLDALAGNLGDQHPSCAWDESRIPGKPISNCAPSKDATLPISCVDWCDAWAYCSWRGKRLCGGTKKQEAPSNKDSPQSRWFLACSANDDGRHAYPYGPAYDAGACNGEGKLARFWASGSVGTCVGGFAGLFDMSGNAVEWENACDPGAEDGGRGDFCRLRGGSKDDRASDLACDYDNTQRRDTQIPDLGFRCCWEP